ncbi:MAG: DsbA family protein [Patescibacteria group bacterium]
MEETQHQHKKSQSLFEFLGPKRAFVFGMVAMFMVASTIGFYILLFGGSISTNTNSASTFAGTANTNAGTNSTAGTNTATAINLAAITSDDHIRGNLDTAEVVLVEYSDLECPYCKQFHTTLQQMSQEYGDKVAWVYRHFPLESLHPKAPKESEASECAYDQGGNDAFWQYIDKIYEITPANNGLDEAKLPEIAGEIGLDVAEFNDCLSSGKFTEKVQQHYQDAINAGGNGTPYSVAISQDGTKVPVSGAQPYSSLKSTIDNLLLN